MIQRSYYFNDLQSFCTQTLEEILGQIALHTPFSLGLIYLTSVPPYAIN